MEEKHTLKKTFLVFFIIISILTCILLYSRYIATKNIQINEHKIVNNNFTDEYYGLKVVHISDIHYGRITFFKELKELVNKVNKVKPDIIVFTGDLIDMDTELSNEEADKISSILSKMNATVGKYAINGNHDYKFKNWELIIQNSGFTNLNNDYDLIYLENKKNILISGISTNLHGSKNITDKLEKTNNYLKEVKEDEKPFYSILLMHEPDYIDQVNINDYNLILAGHSHNGQVRLPFIGALKFTLPTGSKKYYDSYYKIKNTDLYISNGIGTSTINFRLFNKPSFNLYRFVNK